MKYSAKVEQILQDGIHKVVVAFRDIEMIANNMPLPTRVEIEVGETGDAMLYRYQDDGTFCGDTWHETFEDAKHQASYEYGIAEDAWQRVE